MSAGNLADVMCCTPVFTGAGTVAGTYHIVMSLDQ